MSLFFNEIYSTAALSTSACFSREDKAIPLSELKFTPLP
jgi:hypothetical protein